MLPMSHWTTFITLPPRFPRMQILSIFSVIAYVKLSLAILLYLIRSCAQGLLRHNKARKVTKLASRYHAEAKIY